MKRLLFISHEFHQKTKSITFLFRILEGDYEVTQVYLPPSANADPACLEAHAGQGYDAVVCCQILPPLAALQGLGCEHLVLLPMYDDSGRWGLERWFPYRSLRIVSFSRTLAARLQGWGFDAHFLQYFPEPPAAPAPGDPRRAFFWHRTEKISLQTVTTLLDRTEGVSLHVHQSPDPGNNVAPPSPEAVDRFHLTSSTWFESRQEMERVSQACGLYFAPRTYEGIGMSFLEAMAAGQCVIAPDRPTMNEYITHGVTGFLYDPKRPAPLDLGDVPRIQRQTLAYMAQGYERWQRERGSLLTLLEAPVRPRPARAWMSLALHCALHPFQATRGFRQWAFSLRLRRKEWRIQLLGFSWSWKRQ